MCAEANDDRILPCQSILSYLSAIPDLVHVQCMVFLIVVSLLAKNVSLYKTVVPCVVLGSIVFIISRPIATIGIVNYPYMYYASVSVADSVCVCV